jgi:ComF family protein
MLIPYLKRLEDWLFVTQCLLCRDTVKVGRNLCLACISELPWNRIACQQCAAPFAELSSPQETETLICGQCLLSPPFFNQTYAAFAYQMPVIQLITQLKFKQNLTCAMVLSELLLTFLQSKYSLLNWPQAIIPVPLHAKRLAERGYNQADEIAKPLGNLLNIPVYSDLCQRVKQTVTQTTASAKERRQNLKNAFTVVKPHHLNYVAIVDDVLTTGSTVTALATTLKNSGIECIDIWAVAKTIHYLG